MNNYKRSIKRQIKSKKRWVLLNGFVCIFLFTWFILQVSLGQPSIANVYQIIGIIYSAAMTGVLEEEITNLETQLLRR